MNLNECNIRLYYEKKKHTTHGKHITYMYVYSILPFHFMNTPFLQSHSHPPRSQNSVLGQKTRKASLFNIFGMIFIYILYIYKYDYIYKYMNINTDINININMIINININASINTKYKYIYKYK